MRNVSDTQWIALFWIFGSALLLTSAAAVAQTELASVPPMPKLAVAEPGGPSDAILGEAKSLRVSVRRLLDQEQLRQFSLTDLRTLLQELTSDLRFELTELDPSGAWTKSLELDRVGALANDETAWLQTLTRRQLGECAETFAKIMANADYRVIWERWTFKSTMLVLEQAAGDPRDRVRRQLVAAVAQLQAALDQIPNGARWKEYLRLGKLAALAESDSPTAEELQSLPEIVDRFQATGQKPEFGKISMLPAFGRAAQEVRDFNAVCVPPAPAPPPPSVTPVVTQNK